VDTDLGRRERKKRLTRQAISDVATELFLARGFDAVSVAEVAAAADVAVQTVFNHFPTKEDLFFDETGWWSGPARALRDAPSGADVIDTLRGHYQAAFRRRAESGQLVTWPRFRQVMDESPALTARQNLNSQQMEDRIAEALRERDPGLSELTARLVAAQYASAQKVLEGELARLLPAVPDDDAVRAVTSMLEVAIEDVFGAVVRGLTGLL
jgi:AcrR family transcriptional regulator